MDGIDPETNTVYEYHNCFIHSHTCMQKRFYSKHPLYFELTFGDIYAKTLIRIKEIESLGYTVKVFYSCEVQEKLKKWETFLHLSTPIRSCREALYDKFLIFSLFFLLIITHRCFKRKNKLYDSFV